LNPARKQLLKTWTAAGLWMALIAGESTSMMSAAHTTHFLYPFFHYLTGVEFARFVVWDGYLRKAGHFAGYFILSVFLFGAWRATLRLPNDPRWARRWASIAFLMATLIASLDEWHQSYLPSRTGTVHDVFLDGAAALVAQIVIAVFLVTRTTSGAPAEARSI
jgi:hypothetical protein